MVKVRLEQKPAFIATGTKTWISKVEDFFTFWDRCHDDGTVSALKALGRASCEVTGSSVFGVSRVEKDPQNRDFYFYIATEGKHDQCGRFDSFAIPSALWAIFQSAGEVRKALFEAEMHAFRDWLPASGYEHAFVPELEVYPEDGTVEFWLPVVRKQ
ncbi:MAG TPA: GyrI-like domain-containing protein [Clostridia bacterium]|nr:GyrI-like domain-containing protein [Clostridia bacterium]